MLSNFWTPGHTPVSKLTRLLAVAANGTVSIPEGHAITRIYFRNKTANAVTGGIRVGTTASGTDVLAAGAVGASAVVYYAPLIGAYSASGARTLYVEAVTAWNSAVVDVVVETIKLN